jgi:hypothetical protein
LAAGTPGRRSGFASSSLICGVRASAQGRQAGIAKQLIFYYRVHMV